MASYFISGASRGLGLGLCAALVGRPASEVSTIYAGIRTETDELKKLVQRANGRVEIVRLDATSEDEVKKAAAHVEQSLNGKGLDVLLNVAGIMSWTPEGIEHMNDLESTFKINVSSAHLVTSAFLPLLKKGGLKKVINISSTLGSVDMAAVYSGAPSYAYKVSKAALNMLTVQYAMSFAKEGFTFVLISPGWVKTDMGGDAADLDVETSVKATLDIVDRVTKEDNGKFLNIRVPGWENATGLNRYVGEELPW